MVVRVLFGEGQGPLSRPALRHHGRGRDRAVAGWRAGRTRRTLISLDHGPCLVRGMHLPVMRAWGFEPSSMAFVWIKPKRKAFANGDFFLEETLFAKGMGHTTRQNAEYVVLGRRGKPRRLRKDVHQLIIQPRREHSRKPDEFYARVQRYCTGPYLELFARQRRPGWTGWGNELDKFEPEYDAHDDSPNR